MRYDIEHQCGHIDTYNIFGANLERDRKVHYLESISCKACARSHRVENLQECFPDLPWIEEGTEKQVAWAVSIRLESAVKLQKLINRIEREIAPHDPEVAEKGLKIIQETLSKTGFQFWIDQRGNSFDESWLNQAFQQHQELHLESV